MFRHIHRILVTSLAAISCLGCNSQSVDPPVGTMADRKLGFGVTEGSIGYELAFASAKNAGIQFIELPQQWDEVETAPAKYESEFAAMANEVYPAIDTAIVLSLNPIDTNTLRIPEHLQDTRWDSPERIDAFCKWVDWTLAQLPEATIQAIAVGNEVDGLFADHPDELAGYTTFFNAVADHIRTHHPNIPIGVKITFAGRTGTLASEYAKLETSADVCMLTYYPLDETFQVRPPSSIEADFATMMEAAAGKPVHLLEAGYPSGSACGSSLAQQAAFVDAMFAAWDKHVEAVPVINFVWTCDLSESEVNAMTKYYGVELPAFAEYLGTLGLQTNDGKNKPAWNRVRENVANRAD
ncbi:hypothetical protein FHS27_000691 [Rhodopirellula rubra]|uniref:Arabinogalactan endo-beta-1,4-galactanase n=1 Tax=Aporhodopirellula rubra TaxID=980271 RepID=A0A7W5H425_9BACT|nr:hypothetical protein [Aporhodopirellula rubra]MBB3204924.1 hypothetical protein [Aporhodopirellula rubra]